MRVLAILLSLGVLAGCGADGEPIRPSVTTTVGVGTNGTHASTHVSASRGKWTLGVGLGL